MILEKKLEQKKNTYKKVDDINVMENKGFLQAPILEVDNMMLDFSEANKWINEQQKGQINGN